MLWSFNAPEMMPRFPFNSPLAMIVVRLELAKIIASGLPLDLIH